MPNSREQASRLLDLPAADFFNLGEDRLLDLQSALSDAAVGDGNRTAPAPALLEIGVPKEVDATRHRGLPVLVGSVQSGLRAWQVNFTTNLWLLLRNLGGGGELVVITPFNHMRRGEAPLLSGVGTPPDAQTARSTTSAVEPIDLRARLGQWPRPGRYAVTALAYDMRSQTAGLRVAGTAASAEAGFEQKFEKPSRGLIDLPARVPASGPVLLKAALQIAAEPGASTGDAALSTWPCHVVLVKLDEMPIVAAVRVKLERAPGDGGTASFNAAFSLDLRAALGGATGTYRVYVDAGSEMLGPYPLVVEK